MSTWPPGQPTPYGLDELMDGTIPSLWISSEDKTKIFYLMGGMAPFPGVTNGIICKNHPQGLAPKFKHQDVQAALQDGVTWQNTVYEAGLIKLDLEIHARTPQILSQIHAEWVGMWRRGNTPIVEYITPDGGYWTAKARLMPDSFQDPFKLTPRRQNVWAMTTVIRVESAFWETIPSVSSWSVINPVKFSDPFTTTTTTGLGGNWSSTWTPSSHTAQIRVNSAAEVVWSDTGHTATTVINCYTAEATSTDDQVVTVQLGTGWNGVTLFGEAATIIGLRMDGEGNGVFCEIGWGAIQIYCINAGVTTLLYRLVGLFFAPTPGEIWQFSCGVDIDEPRSYLLTRGAAAKPVIGFTESGTASTFGSSYRFTGFGMTSATELLAGRGYPAPIQYFGGGDNAEATYSGFLTLANEGTEPGYPELLITGPGTWEIGNGTNPTISIGPLNAGQTIFLATLPRYQRIVDVSDGTVNTQLFANDSDLQSLISGIFSSPIPGVDTPADAVLTQIPVQVTAGTPASSITATLTPRRIHPA